MNIKIFCLHYKKRMSGLILILIQAAATTCYVATHPRLIGVSGKYFADCNETSPSKLGSNLVEASRLWSASEVMVSKDSGAIFADQLKD